MQFEIKCETFVRLSKIAEIAKQDELKCVRLEHQPGKTFAIVTNRKIAAIELIGNNPFMMIGAVHIATEPALLKQCEIESKFESSLYIDNNPELSFATAKTAMGYQFPGNVAKPVNEILNIWRSWLPKSTPNVSRGGMYWKGENIHALAIASPSTEIVFPETIDVAHAIPVRDLHSENWLGLFMGNYADNDGTVKEAIPATVPEWVK